MYSVYLSPSNQMHNRCKRGDLEGQHCPMLAAILTERLAANGIACKTRNPQNGLSAKIAEAKAFGADLYLTLHTNAPTHWPRVWPITLW